MTEVRLHPEIRMLLREISNYCEAYNVTNTGFGLAAANDGHFIPRLLGGRHIHLHTLDRVRAFMRKDPKAVSKPVAKAKAKRRS